MIYKDIFIKGKMREYFLQLNEKYEITFLDIYLISGVLGFLRRSKDIVEKDDGDAITIGRNVLTNNTYKIEFLYSMIMLYDEIDINPDEAIIKAFEVNDDNQDKIIEKSELFISYAAAGIKILHQMLDDVAYDNQIDNLKELIEAELAEKVEETKTYDRIFEDKGF